MHKSISPDISYVIFHLLLHIHCLPKIFWVRNLSFLTVLIRAVHSSLQTAGFNWSIARCKGGASLPYAAKFYTPPPTPEKPSRGGRCIKEGVWNSCRGGLQNVHPPIPPPIKNLIANKGGRGEGVCNFSTSGSEAFRPSVPHAQSLPQIPCLAQGHFLHHKGYVSVSIVFVRGQPLLCLSKWSHQWHHHDNANVNDLLYPGYFNTTIVDEKDTWLIRKHFLHVSYQHVNFTFINSQEFDVCTSYMGRYLLTRWERIRMQEPWNNVN